MYIYISPGSISGVRMNIYIFLAHLPGVRMNISSFVNEHFIHFPAPNSTENLG